MGISHTLCIVWETDLADAIKSIHAHRVRGLVTMVPAWAFPPGQWYSRPVAEVWVDSSHQGTYVRLLDSSDEAFHAELELETRGVELAGELLLRLPAPRARKPHRRTTETGRGRSLRAQVK